MSATASHDGHSHGPEALAQASATVDPTRTKTLRKNYAQRLRGGYASINAVIREGVRSDDVLGLRTEALAEKPPSFRFETDDTKRARFLAWLRQQLRDEVLSIIARGSNTYVRSAYGRGYQRAATELRKRGVQVDAEDLQTIFNRGQPRRELQRLFTRNFQALQDINEDLDQAISEVLTEGFASGWNPTKMARKLTDRVDAIGKHRATLLARTETIRAYNAGALDRYERHSESIDGIGVRSEWLTAGDTDVCPICEQLEGRVITIGKARTGTFSYDAGPDEPDSLGGEYPLHPPAHPQCRCTFLPVVGA